MSNEYTEFVAELNSSNNRLCKRAATSIAHLSSENEKLKKQIDSAIEAVHESEFEDIGYNVLCALGENP